MENPENLIDLEQWPDNSNSSTTSNEQNEFQYSILYNIRNTDGNKNTLYLKLIIAFEYIY